VEPNPIITALLPPGTAPSSVKSLKELSDEELALRHRFELKVERALYRATTALQELGQQMAYHSPQYSVEHDWRRDPKIQTFLQKAEMALHYLLLVLADFVENYNCQTASHSQSYERSTV
jgi:hypothetical protein